MPPAADKLTIALIMVMSTNGVVAKKRIENSFEWNSDEDKIQFLEKVRQIGTVIMGSNTYRSIGSQPYEGTHFYVLTRHPQKFTSHDRVTFVSGSIPEIIRDLSARGIRKIALLGGPSTNSLFLEQDLVDEIYLTMEPVLMPEGLHLAEGLNRQIPLELIRIEPLNAQKTLLLHYRVIRR